MIRLTGNAARQTGDSSGAGGADSNSDRGGASATGGLAEEPTEAREPLSERDRLRAVLRAAGMVIELSPDEKRLASQSTLTLEEARAILDRTESNPLNEIILEMRGPEECPPSPSIWLEYRC